MSSLSTSLTAAQKDQIMALIDECRALGATPYQLAPLTQIWVTDEELEADCCRDGQCQCGQQALD